MLAGDLVEESCVPENVALMCSVASFLLLFLLPPFQPPGAEKKGKIRNFNETVELQVRETEGEKRETQDKRRRVTPCVDPNLLLSETPSLLLPNALPVPSPNTISHDLLAHPPFLPQIALKNYDPQRDKRFSGVFKLPVVPK